MDFEWDDQDDLQINAEDRERENLALLERRWTVREHQQVLRRRSAAGSLTEAEADELRGFDRELETIVLDLFALNMGLVRSYVARFTGKSSNLAEDLESAGRVGLMQAIDSFQPGRGGFGTWAYKPVKREILLAVRHADHQHLNASDFDRRPAVLRAAEAWAASHPADTPQDIVAIAKAANTTVPQTRRILHSVRLESLNAPSSGLDSSTLAERIGDQGPTVEEQALLALDVHSLWQGIDLLDAREIYVLTRRFGLDGEAEQTLEAIGRTLGLSREAVRQIQVKALAKLSHDVFLPRAAEPADPAMGAVGQAELSSPERSADAGSKAAQDAGLATHDARPTGPEREVTTAPDPDSADGENAEDEPSAGGVLSAPTETVDAGAADAGYAPPAGDGRRKDPHTAEQAYPDADGAPLGPPDSWVADPPARVRPPRHHYPSGPIDMQWTAGPSPPPTPLDGSDHDPAAGRADGG